MKATPAKSAARIVRDDDDEVPSKKSSKTSLTEISEEAPEVTVTAPVLVAAPVAAPAPVVAAATVSVSNKLKVVFLESLFDYPVIGAFNFQTEFGITMVKKHQSFVVPREVALVLLDKKLVAIPEFIQ